MKQKKREKLQACKRAKTSIRLLLVVLHDETKAVSSALVGEALSSSAVGEILRVSYCLLTALLRTISEAAYMNCALIRRFSPINF